MGKIIKGLAQNKNEDIQLGTNYKTDLLEIHFIQETKVNCILLKEAVQWGQRVKSFNIELYNNDSLIYKNAYTTIGHQRIISFPTKSCNRILIQISDARSEPILSGLSVYHIPEMLVEK